MNHFTNKKSKYSLSLFLIAIPFIIYIFVFSYVPIFGWIIAFFDYKPGMSFAKMDFVGLNYFQLAFSGNSQLGQVMVNTFVMSFLGLLSSPLAVFFAVFLSEIGNTKFKKVIQTTTTLPYFVSWIIIYGVAYSLFSTDGGLVNDLLIKFGVIKESYPFLAKSEIAWVFQTLLRIWKDLGFGSIVYLAAIAGISTELYDAAKVDGAGRLSIIRHITIPGIIPTFFVLFLLSISNILNSGFDQYYVFMNSMVANKINVLDYYLYNVGIAMNNFSFATAMGMSKSLVSVTLLFMANWLAKRVRGESII